MNNEITAEFNSNGFNIESTFDPFPLPVQFHLQLNDTYYHPINLSLFRLCFLLFPIL